MKDQRLDHHEPQKPHTFAPQTKPCGCVEGLAMIDGALRFVWISRKPDCAVHGGGGDGRS